MGETENGRDCMYAHTCDTSLIYRGVGVERLTLSACVNKQQSSEHVNKVRFFGVGAPCETRGMRIYGSYPNGQETPVQGDTQQVFEDQSKTISQTCLYRHRPNIGHLWDVAHTGSATGSDDSLDAPVVCKISSIGHDHIGEIKGEGDDGPGAFRIAIQVVERACIYHQHCCAKCCCPTTYTLAQPGSLSLRILPKGQLKALEISHVNSYTATDLGHRTF
eukprot:395657-Pleurochrysis_carterae.AAC.15